ncbi:S9 family peptidase [Carboxylicivirga caseinilyticus]|uniref:S9 family peptidase n=1 Tax=Carboxylicivirga caseinilyticus TaxID=3417572 RepID=UPI003D3252FF|nr:S9 family peptidase [Marinilabiliaceae bacterium A049]
MTDKFRNGNTVLPPIANRYDRTLLEHGHNRNDPYYWMRLTDDQKHNNEPDAQTTDVLNYLNGENSYCEQILKPTEQLRDDLYIELSERIQVDVESIPVFENEYWYYTRYNEGSEYPIYCRKHKTMEAEEQILLDANIRAKDVSFYNVVGLTVTSDNRILAFGEDTIGRRIYTIRFINLVTGEILPDKIKNSTGIGVWANDNKTFFYTTKNSVSLLSNKIWRHKLGTVKKDENLVLHEKDSSFYIGVSKSKSGEYIFIHEQSTLSSNFYFINANTPDETFTPLTPLLKNHKYYIDHYHDRFYIRTNLNAENFRLMSTDIHNHTIENWKEIIPHDPEVFIQCVEIFEDFLVLEERCDALPQIRIINQRTGKKHYIKFNEEAYKIRIETNPDYFTHTLRFKYSSMTTPDTIIDYDMESREQTFRKSTRIPGHNSNDFITRRLYAKARDGELIPISLVYKKGLSKSENNPCLMYSYGAYGESVEASFNANILSLLNRGFIYAVAHVRGGQTKGRIWYENGKLLNKKNTFYDFQDCARFLITERYTSPDHLYATGESAGGLLMGVTANMADCLFNGIIAEVPFVDVVTTMLDETIPLTTNEFHEWGNPKILEYYKYMLSYSPYDQVKAKPYPNLLVTTGFHDSQVQYWEPAKWVAKLRHYKTDNNLLLLSTNMETGHFGASGRFERMKELAMNYSFILMLEQKNKITSDCMKSE